MLFALRISRTKFQNMGYKLYTSLGSIQFDTIWVINMQIVDTI